jgi:ABC-type enterochelin transport system substrate-binding protein
MRSLRLTSLAAVATLLLGACASGGDFEKAPSDTAGAAEKDGAKADASESDAGTDVGAVDTAPPLDLVLPDGQSLPDWLQASCDTQYVGTGVKEGDIAYDFVQTDQYGQDLRLHDFCDHVVLLIGSAFW